ncbi:hypothetical protein [Streptomyces sp. NBC_00582]|uniref:hypothetical protein n=1 Tax=Streptomyces sp. NBC_00582 TaxID=2975783 RepID=UPI002E824418|nr:hypothetical protein [Streptomyces sp. NBC_00582]WUB62160.1 hypothetical protein OG852_18045 [Streptomyces sp. NBC_00582]
MIKPEEIPQFTGNLFQLELDHAALKKDAGDVRTTGSDVDAQFQGLSAFYKAPEAEQLFATTKPVRTRADDFATDLETVSSALSSYATEIRPLVSKLLELKTKASTFVASVKDDDEWEYDEDKVDEHNRLRDDITATVAAFWAAERTCHNKITAIWGGTQMVAGDGSERKDQYGFNAEDLKNAKLPWGDPVEERHHWYEVGHWVKSFVWDGLIVDGIWGTIKGLGTLVGFGGWDAMGQAWKGLAQLATGLALASIPGVGTAFWLIPDDKLPSWIRDSRTAMKETGKALVAWDEWGKNPGRAAGAVTFNVLTTVFTGGAGGAAAGAGKAGAVAKALSIAGKAGKVIDPMTYIAKGAGAGLSKIGDISKALKGMGNIEIPKLPENAITLPEGTVKLPDGTFHLPEGAALPEGATKLPDGNVKLPDHTPALPEGSVKLPTDAGAPARYYDPQGNLLDENGTVLKEAQDGPGDIVDQPDPHTPASGADTPHVDSPAKEPALVGAGTHTAESGAQHINLGNSLDTDLGDIGRTADNTPTVHTGDNLPGGTADHLPGGGVGDNTPRNSIDTPAPVGTGDNAIPGTSTSDHAPGGHTTETGPAGGHDLPGHGPETPPGAGLDDLGGLGDDALDHADGLGDDTTPPGHHGDEGTGHGTHDGQRELTVEERKRIQEEHVWKANHDEAWRETHYNEIGRRRSAERIVDGVELPILTKDANGNWIARHDLPSGPSEVRFNPGHLGPETAAEHSRPHLDEAARNRRLSVDLINAEKKFEETPSTANAEELARAQEAYAKHLKDIPNNSKHSEHLGEAAARHHVIPKEFPGADPVELPKTPNGANMFDDVYKLGDDGHYIIVEEKAPSGDLDWRQGKSDPDPADPTVHDGGAQGMRVKQGTRPYIRTILAEMTNRGGRDAEIAADLRAALRDGKLQYVLVKASDNAGHSYAGATIEHLKI